MEKMEHPLQQESETKEAEVREPAASSATGGLQSEMEQMAVMQSVYHEQETTGPNLSPSEADPSSIRDQLNQHREPEGVLLQRDVEEELRRRRRESLRAEQLEEEQQQQQHQQQQLLQRESVLREAGEVDNGYQIGDDGLEEEQKQQAAREAVMRQMKSSFQGLSQEQEEMVENPSEHSPQPHVIMPTNSPTHDEQLVERPSYTSSPCVMLNEKPPHSTLAEN